MRARHTTWLVRSCKAPSVPADAAIMRRSHGTAQPTRYVWDPAAFYALHLCLKRDTRAHCLVPLEKADDRLVPFLRPLPIRTVTGALDNGELGAGDGVREGAHDGRRC